MATKDESSKIDPDNIWEPNFDRRNNTKEYEMQDAGFYNIDIYQCLTLKTFVKSLRVHVFCVRACLFMATRQNENPAKKNNRKKLIQQEFELSGLPFKR